MKKIKNYPIIENGKKRYVRWPKKNSNSKWVAVDVMQSGYKEVFAAVEYDKEKDCQKACDISNEFFGWSKEEAIAIVGQSMDNCELRT